MVGRPRWASCRARFTATINIPRERPEGVQVSAAAAVANGRPDARGCARPGHRPIDLRYSARRVIIMYIIYYYYILYCIDTHYAVWYYIIIVLRMPKVRVTVECGAFSDRDHHA